MDTTELSETAQAWIKVEWPEYEAWAHDVDNGSERVAMIVGGAMLDLVLRRMIAAFLIDDEKIATEVLGTEESGGERPLGSFSTRIKACQALGLIGDRERKILDTLRQIRNHFAHKLSDRISEQSLDDLTKNLFTMLMANPRLEDKYARHFRSSEPHPRHVLLRWCLSEVTIALTTRIRFIEHCKLHPSPLEL